MKNFVRLITLLLALLMLAMVVVACDSGEEENPNYNPDYDVNNRLKDSLPDNLNYLGEEIKVLYWSDVEKPEFEVETLNGDNVNDAIYTRNSDIESRLNVTLKWAGTPGNVNQRANFCKKVQQVTEAGSHDYDIIASYSRTEGMLAIQGQLIDLTTIKDPGEDSEAMCGYIDLEKPWWPQRLIDTVKIGDSIYFLSGDASTNVLHLMYTMYYNKTIVDEEGLTDPATYVYDGSWTIDKLIELTSDFYKDSDSDGKVSEGDTYGFCTNFFHVDSFYTGSNLTIVEHDATEVLKISSDYSSRKTVNLVKKLGSWLTTDDCWVDKRTTSLDEEKPFVEGRALFCHNRAYFAENHLLKVKFSYGLVPIPKYDEKQVNYYTVEANPFTLYGIYSDLDVRGDKEATLQMLSAVLECWASEGYRWTTPEIFEVNMQLKYAETQQETDMFEYVRSNITFELGRIFSNDLSFISEIPSDVACAGASWSTTYNQYKNSLNAQMEEIVNKFKEQQSRA